METLVMNEALKGTLKAFGFNAELIEAWGLWGVLVSGSPHHITLRMTNGEECHYADPLVAVVAGGQVAIVR